MEFGLIRVAQKDSMYLSCILVIFSIAGFWLNILYAKVIVRNTREGIFGGNIFRKTEIPLIFVETIIEEDIPETSCAKIVLLILFVWLRSHCFLRFLIHWGKCTASAALRTWSGGQFGATVTLSMTIPVGSFQKGSWGCANPPASMAVDESWPGCFVDVDREPSIMHPLHDLTPSGACQRVRLYGIVYWDLTM